jgi:adenine-specific DNA-methyltransferase
MSEGERLAQRLAEDFSLERLKDFLFEKDFTVEESQPPIELKEKLKEHVRSIRQVAYKELEDVGNFNVYAIELKENITERSSKKRQFEIAKEILKAYQLIAGLFVFYPQEGKSFRFSLVFTEPYGTRREYSPYKRYTYFVSPELPNKTFIKQVGGCEFKDLKEIKSAFSVQPLTKEFYKEIQTWFYHALENYEKEIFFPGGQKEENLIRLITRLMFVWFIKQMGLVPEKLFDPKELKNIVKDFENGHNYYNAVLQNLFFATLNRPINERGWAKDEGFLKNRNTFGIKSLYRYEDKFLISPEEVLGLFENIPFINGGLFECLDKDSQYIDGFSRRPDKQAKVPDKYFFQEKEQETDLSKYGLGRAKFRGLISIFKDYNWTTDESSPIDQEVALDPELLGKVFENLLASYNPETATTARKATGSYYTPKEIVDYMVEESLKEYFKTKTNLSEEKIENLFYQEEPQLSDEERRELVRAIADVKIIDPACGSGAFCMGALHKLVELLNRIDPTNELWKSEQLRRLTNELSERWEEMNEEERKEEIEYLLEVFNEQRNYPDYGRKLYLIQNCIYGVDIQPIAVQLTKLRFFLSLILDQKPSNDKNNNFGILPLPHLETKFVCANTLIGLESSRQRSIKSQEVMKIERELKRIRERYFRVRNRKQKQELEEKDRELREKLAELLKKQGWDNKDVQKIISFDILDPTAKADWFDPEWMFGVVDGFDVVIGNPPYVRQEYIEDKEKIIESISKCFIDQNGKSLIKINKRSDLYVYFYYKGLDLLKVNGILCYVSSNSWLDVGYGRELQEFLLRYMHVLMVVDNLIERSFDADINTVIVFIKRPKSVSWDDITKFIAFKIPFEEANRPDILIKIHQTQEKIITEEFRVIPKTRKELWIEGIETEDDEIKEKYLWKYKYAGNKWGGKYLRAPEIFYKILEKGKGKLVRLGDIAEVKRGFTTGANEFFYLEPTGKPAPKGLLHVKNSVGWEGYIEEEFLKPVIKSPKELKTIIVREEDLKYRVFMCHKSKNELKGTYALEYIEWGEKQGYHKRPTCASRQRWWDLGENKYQVISKRFVDETFSYFFNQNNFFVGDTFFIINAKLGENKNMCLYLNSTLGAFFTEQIGRKNMGDGVLLIYGPEITNIPVLNNEYLYKIYLTTDDFLEREQKIIFEELGFQKCTQKNCNHPEHPYEYVKPEEVSFDRIMPDRRELDKIIFEVLGLTEEEQLEVYRAVLELVKNRLLKAKSR